MDWGRRARAVITVGVDVRVSEARTAPAKTAPEVAGAVVGEEETGEMRARPLVAGHVRSHTVAVQSYTCLQKLEMSPQRLAPGRRGQDEWLRWWRPRPQTGQDQCARTEKNGRAVHNSGPFASDTGAMGGCTVSSAPDGCVPYVFFEVLSREPPAHTCMCVVCVCPKISECLHRICAGYSG